MSWQSSLAAEPVARNVSVIVAYDVPSAFAAKEATKTIPVVFGVGADPVMSEKSSTAPSRLTSPFSRAPKLNW